MGIAGSNNLFRSAGGGSSSALAGAKNYLTTYNGNAGNGDFELNLTTGWSLGTVTLTSALPTGAPTFGSGANGNLSFATTSSGKLAGSYSGSYASSSATTAGNFLASNAFTIDTEDQAKVLSFKFYYSPTVSASNGNWSGTSSNSFGVAIYDVTNSAWIIPAGIWSMTQSSGVGYATGTFQSTSNSTSYRLVVYNSVATAGAITILFDDFFLGPQIAPIGAPMSDWTSFTPTGSWSTNTTYAGKWRRVGDSMEVQYHITLAGAPTSATLTVNLPTGYTIDTAKLAAGTTANVLVPVGTAQVIAAANGYFGQAHYNSTTSLVIRSLVGAASTNPYAPVTQAVPGTFANGDEVDITAMIPIVGWSSSVQMSNDTDTRVVAARMTGATATVTGSYSDITWTTIANDTHGAMGSISYTVPVTGYYDIIGAIDVGAATLSAAGGFFVGLNTGSIILENKFIFDLNVPENESLYFNYGSVLLNAGSTFKLQVMTTGTVGSPVINSSATRNFLAIKRLSGPAVVASIESVNARYNSATATITGSFSTATFTTKNFDSHGAYSAGSYTVPVSGIYSVAAQALITATYAATNASGIAIYLNGVSYAENYFTAEGSFTVAFDATIADEIKCVAGDLITIRVLSTATTPTINNVATRNKFAITRVGN